MEYEFAVDIDAPVDEVWPVLLDVERWSEWTPSVTSAQPLDEGPLAVGSRVRLRQPKTQPLVWTVVELEPGRAFVWTASTVGTTLTAAHRLTGDLTGVRLENSIRVSGWSSRLLLPLIGGQVRHYLRLETEGLKRRCEPSAANR